MRKVDRLKWVERVFGPEFVLPYRVCGTWGEIEAAAGRFEEAGRTWGVRTDLRAGLDQGYGLPFLHHGSMAGAREVWSLHGDRLVYIVSENVLRRRLSAVAARLDAEHVLFEWNGEEPEISQRQMYDRPENLRRVVLGPSGFFFAWGVVPIRCAPPEYASDIGFDRIHDVMVHFDVGEATFTVREDGKVVVW